MELGKLFRALSGGKGVVRFERSDDRSARRGILNRAVMPPQNFSTGSNQDGMRERPGPLRIECGNEFILTSTGVEIVISFTALFRDGGLNAVGEARALPLQKRLGFRFILRGIQADRYEFEVSHVELTGERNEQRKFFDTRRTPRGPNIDEAKFIGGVRAQISHGLGIGPIHGDGNLGPG